MTLETHFVGYAEDVGGLVAVRNVETGQLRLKTVMRRVIGG